MRYCILKGIKKFKFKRSYPNTRQSEENILYGNKTDFNGTLLMSIKVN